MIFINAPALNKPVPRILAGQESPSATLDYVSGLKHWEWYFEII